MNVLGHPYVASKVTGRLNKYLVIGSHLPDLVPFVPNPIFTFEEIHEGGEKLLRFLDEKYPRARDLAIGMITHSYKFGADKFNREIENWLLDDNKQIRDELALKIVDCSAVTLRVAKKYRMHNYLWSGIDLYLLEHETKFVRDLAEIHGKINRKEIADLLAECFEKEQREVKRMVNYLLKPIKPELFISLDGLTSVWKVALAGLPEKDKVDKEKTKKLFKEIYQRYKNRWQDILEKVITDVKVKVKPFLQD